ncbi:MAG TPA: hypothetical protein VLA29_00515 [Acidimicrobiia bacterium]|nr:hypothetical protein [Acidimicrobiia bacterium]
MRFADHRQGVELTTDPLFERRVRRLVVVSAVALGLISWLAIRSGAPRAVVVLLMLGWVIMPVVLAASLSRPLLRYTLILPATLVTVGLVGMILSTDGTELLGWTLIALGITLGGSLGMWLWYRWFPVPYVLDDPYGVPRLMLLSVHVVLVVSGVVLVLVSL